MKNDECKHFCKDCNWKIEVKCSAVYIVSFSTLSRWRTLENIRLSQNYTVGNDGSAKRRGCLKYRSLKSWKLFFIKFLHYNFMFQFRAAREVISKEKGICQMPLLFCLSYLITSVSPCPLSKYL